MVVNILCISISLLGFCVDCPLSICFSAFVWMDSPNPSAFSARPASISAPSKAVQMAFSQRLTAVVLRSLTNELLYCLFPSLCTDGRVLSKSVYCYWMDSARCLHSAAILSFFFPGFYRFIYFFFFVMCPNYFNLFQCLRKGKVFV